MKQFFIISFVSSLALLPVVAHAVTSVVNNVSASASSSTGVSSAYVEATTIIDGKVVAQEEYFDEVDGDGVASASVESEVIVRGEEGSATPTYAGEGDIVPTPPSASTSSATGLGPEQTEEVSQHLQEGIPTTAPSGGNEERGTVVEKIVSALREGVETITSKVHHALTSLFA